MKKLILFLTILACATSVFSQDNPIYGSKVIIRKRDTSSAELQIINSTRNVTGFLKNTGNGNTTFKLLTQSDITGLPDSLLARYTKTQSDARYKPIGYFPAWAEITGIPANFSTTYALSNDIRDSLLNKVSRSGSYANPSWITSLDYSKLTGTVPTWNQNTTGNAATVTNGVYTTGSYTDPSWITSLAWSKVSGAPSFITGINSSMVTAALGYTPENLANKGIANGYADLDATGKIPASRIDFGQTGQTFVVSSQSAMLAVSGANVGALAVRTDENKNYRLIAQPSSTLSNWQVLLAPDAPVQSVNGFTGNVNLLTTHISEGSNYWWTAARSRAAQSLTTSGNNGSATYDNTTGVLNVPTYTLAGLGGISLSSLSFTPGSGGYNNTTGVITIPTNTNQLTNGAGYITSSALSTYVDLSSAQTISGTKTFSAQLEVTGNNVRVSHSSDPGILLNNNTTGTQWSIRSNSSSQLVFNNGAGSGISFGSSSNITASQFIRNGGTSSQFLKADGSVDANTYATTSSLSGFLPLSAGSGQALTGWLYTNSPVNSNVGNIVVTSSDNDASGISFRVRSSPSSSDSRSWMIHNNYSAAGTFEILRSTTSTGNPTTTAFRINSNSDAILSGTLTVGSSSGNIGLGITPYAWAGGYRSVDNLIYNSSYSNNGGLAGMSFNAYHDGTNWVYKNTTSANRFESTLDDFRWFSASSGTAGTAISFTEGLRLSRTALTSFLPISGTSATFSGNVSLSTGANLSLSASSPNFTRIYRSGGLVLENNTFQITLSDAGVTTLPSTLNGTSAALNSYSATYNGGAGLSSFSAGRWLTQPETSVITRTYFSGSNASTYGVWELYSATSTGSPVFLAKFQQPQIDFNVPTVITSNGGNEQFKILRSSNTNQQLIFGYHSANYGQIQAVEQGIAGRALVLNPIGGQILINTTTNNGTDALQVAGSGLFNRLLRINNTNQNLSLILRNDGSNTYYPTIGFSNGAETGYYGYIQANPTGSTSMDYYANNFTFKNINTSANLFTVGSTGAIIATSSVTASSFVRSGGTSSQFLMADGSVSTGSAGVTLDAGNYTPTLTNTTNISSSTLTYAHYKRVGNIVTVYLQASAVTAAAGNTELTISLPIATSSPQFVLTGSGQDEVSFIVIPGSSTASTIGARWSSIGASSSQIYITFQYRIV